MATASNLVIIAFLSQKGGVAKSTLARALAAVLTHQGEWSVRIADIDTQQQTSKVWHETRVAAGIEPQLDVEFYTNVTQALRDATTGDGLDFLIIDVKGLVDKDTLTIAEIADVIIQPTSGSADDLGPCRALFSVLIEAGVDPAKMLCTLARIDSAREAKEAREKLSDLPVTILENTLETAVSYKFTMEEGYTILETTKPSLNERAGEVIKEMLAKILDIIKVRAPKKKSRKRGAA